MGFYNLFLYTILVYQRTYHTNGLYMYLAATLRILWPFKIYTQWEIKSQKSSKFINEKLKQIAGPANGMVVLAPWSVHA